MDDYINGDYTQIDKDHRYIKCMDENVKMYVEIDALRKENEQLRRQLEDVRIHVANVQRLWQKMKDDMEIK